MDVILHLDLSKLAFLWQIVSLNYSNPLWRILVFCFKTPPMNTSIRSPSVLWGIEGNKSASEGSSLLGVPDSIRCQWQILQPSDRCVLACNGFGWFQGERVPSPLYTGIAFVIMSPTQLTCVVFFFSFFSGGADVTITKIFFLIRFIPLYIFRKTTYLFNSLSEFFESTNKSAKSKLQTFKVLIFLTFIDVFATFLDFWRK